MSYLCNSHYYSSSFINYFSTEKVVHLEKSLEESRELTDKLQKEIITKDTELKQVCIIFSSCSYILVCQY